MEPFFLVLYAMNGNDFNVILDKKEPPSRAGSASVQKIKCTVLLLDLIVDGRV